MGTRQEGPPRPGAGATAVPGRPADGRPASESFGTPPDSSPASADTPASPASTRQRRPRWLRWALILLVGVPLAALIGIKLPSWLGPRAGAGLLFASGRIEGRITTLTPKSSAWVVVLHVEEGEAVQSGQLLATLDDQGQRERVRAAQEQVNALTRRLSAADINLVMTKRQVALQIDQANAALGEAAARLRRARANLVQAQRDAERAAVLVAKELIAPQVAEHARLKAEVEEHGVREAEEALVSSQKQLSVVLLGHQQIQSMLAERDALERQRMQAEALLAEQRSLIADFAIRSPISGRVLTRTVERGERVEAGTPLFTLVDLDRLYVKIYVPEPSIGKLAIGQEARVYVDAYPGRAFSARLSRVAHEAEFTPKNVETREERVKLVFAIEVALAENPGGVLKPGMPADAVIRWQPDAPWVTPTPASRSGLWGSGERAPAK